MAIARGNESKESQEFKRYIGIAPVMIKAINPSKKEHEELFSTTLDSDPENISVVTDNDGNEFQSARIQVIFQPDTDKIGIEMPLVTMALFIQNRARIGANSGKTQVIDKYGRTAWVTQEELASHAIPVYSNGPANIDKDYRPAYVGEEELMEFVKTYLCIPSPTVWDNNLKKQVPNDKVKPEECECRFDNLDKIFKGDFSEIKEALGFQPTNKVKILLGVRTDTNTGRLYQTVYTKKFLRNSSNNFNAMGKEIEEMRKNAMENGRMLNTEYEACAVHEYSVTPTPIAPVETESEDFPFSESSSTGLPWD